MSQTNYTAILLITLVNKVMEMCKIIDFWNLLWYTDSKPNTKLFHNVAILCIEFLTKEDCFLLVHLNFVKFKVRKKHIMNGYSFILI
jgi:hypothetical protein